MHDVDKGGASEREDAEKMKLRFTPTSSDSFPYAPLPLHVFRDLVEEGPVNARANLLLQSSTKQEGVN